MRVHELAEKLGIAKADLSEFLEGLGEKGHHLSHVSHEAELLARDHFAAEPEPLTPAEAFAVDPEGSVFGDLQAELGLAGEALAKYATSAAVASLSALDDKAQASAEALKEWESQQVWTDPDHWSTDGEVREVDTPTIDPTLPAATGDHVPVPDADRIPLLADNGAYRGTLCLDPTTAERLRAALKGRSVADATLHPERGELVAVTWPCYQKLVVRTDG